MVKSNTNNCNGFTFVELLLGLALLGVVIAISSQMLIFGTTAHRLTANDYQLQSGMRIAATTVNQTVKYSTAIFTIPRDSFRADNLTAGWNYFGLSEDKTEIIQYIYHRGTPDFHEKVVIVPSLENMVYDMTFKKTQPQEVDKLITFNISGRLGGSATNKIDFSSELEALNALQVVDKGTTSNPAVAIAYRADERPSDVKVGAITMVLDRSGSMKYNLPNSPNPGTYKPEPDQRITKLKNSTLAMIDEFSKEDNIEMCIVPFSNTANGTHTFYDVGVPAEKTAINTIVSNLSGDGGTNTGDGMRRGYHSIVNFPTSLPSGFSARNYMIILTDGVTTYYTSGKPTGDGDAGSFAGNGGTLDPDGTAYVQTIGALIRNFSNPIKVYVIGFSGVASELGSVNNIATAAGADLQTGPAAATDDVYYFTEGLDLDLVFAEIKADIMKDLWHIRGPIL